LGSEFNIFFNFSLLNLERLHYLKECQQKKTKKSFTEALSNQKIFSIILTISQYLFFVDLETT